MVKYVEVVQNPHKNVHNLLTEILTTLQCLNSGCIFAEPRGPPVGGTAKFELKKKSKMGVFVNYRRRYALLFAHSNNTLMDYSERLHV